MSAYPPVQTDQAQNVRPTASIPPNFHKSRIMPLGDLIEFVPYRIATSSIATPRVRRFTEKVYRNLWLNPRARSA